MRGLVLLAAAVVAFAGGCAHRGAPAAYPDIDHEAAPARLAIVEVLASDYLPPLPECTKPEVMCLDPAPTWIKLQVLETLNGDPLPRTVYASTTSHYGKMTQYGLVEGPQLMLLLGEGEQLVMARYARAPLRMDSARRFHLLLHNAGPRWLPCAVADLREPVTDPVLARAGAVPRKWFDQSRAEGDSGEAYYRLEPDFAYHRYSLPVGKLEDYLAGQVRPAAAYRCQRGHD